MFKGKEVNFDPREVYVRELFAERGNYNLFHEFYHELVHALAGYGVSSNVYCVNIDAVIEPAETRPRLIDALEVMCSKREQRPPKKHGNIPM